MHHISWANYMFWTNTHFQINVAQKVEYSPLKCGEIYVQSSIKCKNSSFSWVNVHSHAAASSPCSVEVKAGQVRGVWWAQTCPSIPSPAGTAAGPWGPRGAHLQRGARQQHKEYEWLNKYNEASPQPCRKMLPVHANAHFTQQLPVWVQDRLNKH